MFISNRFFNRKLVNQKSKIRTCSLNGKSVNNVNHGLNQRSTKLNNEKKAEGLALL